MQIEKDELLNQAKELLKEEVTQIAYETWFKQFVSSDGGIYVGRGINNNTLYSISTSFRILNEQIPPNFGYVVDNGIATRIKVLEGDE